MKKSVSQHSYLLTVVFLICVSIFPLITAYLYPLYLNDDAFITLTYVKNLANGNGFVFNHPPAVLGTTTPLFAIAVAGLASLLTQVDIPALAVFLTAFCWLGIAWVFFFFRKEWELDYWHVCIIALVVVGSGWIVTLGMEAYPFAFLLVLTVSLFLHERYWLAGIGVGLLFLTRGEGSLVLVTLGITALIQQWHTKKTIDIEFVHKILKLGIGFSLPLLLWSMYAIFTFGSVLPNTLSAKKALGLDASPLIVPLVNEWMPLWRNAFEFGALPLFNFWWLIVLVGFIDAILHKRKWLILVSWIFLYIAGYSLLSVATYWWYQLPVLFVFDLFFALGIIAIIEVLTKYLKSTKLSFALAALFVALLIFLLAKPTVDRMLNYEGDTRGESYVALGQWLSENTEPSESVSFIEIGYLGYFTDNRIIDLVGLVLPDVIPFMAEGDFAGGFWHHEPDYYVYLSDFDWALADIKNNPRFDQEYQPVTTLPGPREADFVIYERVSP